MQLQIKYSARVFLCLEDFPDDNRFGLYNLLLKTNIKKKIQPQKQTTKTLRKQHPLASLGTCTEEQGLIWFIVMWSNGPVSEFPYIL